jgi:putative sigma-54 modulation protein
MEIRIQAIKFTASEQLEAHINKRLSKLTRVYDDIVSVDVYLKVVKPETSQNKEVEIKIQSSLGEFFASKTTDTFEESTDLAVEALDRQLAKSKEKVRG